MRESPLHSVCWCWRSLSGEQLNLKSSANNFCRAQQAGQIWASTCKFCLQEQLRVQKVQQSKAILQSKDRKVRSAQRERRRLRALLGQDIPDDLLQSAGEMMCRPLPMTGKLQHISAAGGPTGC